MDEPKSPDCPVCGEPPMMVMGGGTQAFCGNGEGCPVMTWNPMNSREEFFRTAKQIEIRPSGDERAPADGGETP
jgi:hypothetical protein